MVFMLLPIYKKHLFSTYGYLAALFSFHYTNPTSSVNHSAAVCISERNSTYTYKFRITGSFAEMLKAIVLHIIEVILFVTKYSQEAKRSPFFLPLNPCLKK